MSINQVLILLNGEDHRVLSKNTNQIIISNKKIENISQDHTLLESDFESIEDFIKAEIIIKNQFSKIDELVIINKNIDLNMISYQYDYNHISNNYKLLINIIYFINLLIPLYNNNFSFILALEKNNHFKIHLNNFNLSLMNYLSSLKLI